MNIPLDPVVVPTVVVSTVVVSTVVVPTVVVSTVVVSTVVVSTVVVPTVVVPTVRQGSTGGRVTRALSPHDKVTESPGSDAKRTFITFLLTAYFTVVYVCFFKKKKKEKERERPPPPTKSAKFYRPQK